MVGWHHRLSGRESEQTSEDSGEQRSPACCSPWGRKDTTRPLNNNSWLTMCVSFRCNKVVQLYIYLFFFKLLSQVSCYRLWSRVPGPYSRSLVLIHFWYGSVYKMWTVFSYRQVCGDETRIPGTRGDAYQLTLYTDPSASVNVFVITHTSDKNK